MDWGLTCCMTGKHGLRTGEVFAKKLQNCRRRIYQSHFAVFALFEFAFELLERRLKKVVVAITVRRLLKL